MIRIVDKRHEHPRYDCPDTLQPIATIDTVPGYRIEVLPKVHMFNDVVDRPEVSEYYGVSEDPHGFIHDMTRLLVAQNAHDGKLLFDCKVLNLGMLNDRAGTPVPVIVDAGAAVNIKEVNAEEYRFFADCFLSSGPDRMDFYKHFPDAPQKTSDIPVATLKAYVTDVLAKEEHPAMNYEEAQQLHLERLGMAKGELKGLHNLKQLEQVIVDFQLERLPPDASKEQKQQVRDRANKEQPEELYPQALKAGVSDSEFGQALVKGAQNLESEKEKTFVRYLQTGNEKLLSEREGLCENTRRVLRHEHGVDMPPGRGRN